jgi:hypothetical protein
MVRQDVSQGYVSIEQIIDQVAVMNRYEQIIYEQIIDEVVIGWCVMLCTWMHDWAILITICTQKEE